MKSSTFNHHTLPLLSEEKEKMLDLTELNEGNHWP